MAERYRGSRIVAFSTGNVYPLTPVLHGGPTETSPVGPVGEYAQSCLGRERMFDHFSRQYGTPVTMLRLNYAVELRYGVLVDIGQKVFERCPVDLRMGHANVIWQGDANSVCLRSFSLCASPPAVLNLTGPEVVSVRWVAKQFGERFGVEPVLQNSESENALLSNAARCQRLFGYPRVSVEQMIDWIAEWITIGGPTLNKPTHFETRDGKVLSSRNAEQPPPAELSPRRRNLKVAATTCRPGISREEPGSLPVRPPVSDESGADPRRARGRRSRHRCRLTSSRP